MHNFSQREFRKLGVTMEKFSGPFVIRYRSNRMRKLYGGGNGIQRRIMTGNRFTKRRMTAGRHSHTHTHTHSRLHPIHQAEFENEYEYESEQESS
jgi:hypothetical protein